MEETATTTPPTPPSIPNSSKKRKSHCAFSSSQTTSSDGRGRLSGWTACPLCPSKSMKRFALGRGISTHLHAVHTPWNPSKSELRNREQVRRRLERESKKGGIISSPDVVGSKDKWDPTPSEVEEWDARVLKLTSQLERESPTSSIQTHKKQRPLSDRSEPPAKIVSGYDRLNKPAISYHGSLPPFLRSAADGDIDALRELAKECVDVSKLLHSRDRNGSTAENWAAGGGHLDCLKFLIDTRNKCTPMATVTNVGSKIRRRDGKTALHFAARNGHCHCITYLLDHAIFSVDEPTGDGTTPLHMACYGGHRDAVLLLINRGASPLKRNEWGCGTDHWIAMTINQDQEQVLKICEHLKKECGLRFVMEQRHGHTPLHKAAMKKNECIIEWMARDEGECGAGLGKEEMVALGCVDDGGNKPSDIYLSSGGHMEFGTWMRDTCGW